MFSSGFDPVAGPKTSVLILGTLPGQVSLQNQQYYAQPRNQFWKVMGQLLGFDPQLPYAARIQHLKDRGVALWDVCAAAHRPGSLDSSIAARSVLVNPFDAFFRTHSELKLVCFNGAKAAALFKRDVLPTLTTDRHTYVTLPSTSPAHAAMSFDKKLAEWSVILGALEE
jgi:double-stranded uracil-DNA glycosylase